MAGDRGLPHRVSQRRVHSGTGGWTLHAGKRWTWGCISYPGRCSNMCFGVFAISNAQESSELQCKTWR
ncbi:hypothetical protein PsYK624_083230 [Phanerochaete sordida]|uniref:Uncharacterized protein n=1 Tax=Phanerochaete sordida TaxID=48140 RepID=A0A9P3LEE6_9APHY|nr:hypothetical protein PsYK624_083230 [Phanerochaete sordida]